MIVHGFGKDNDKHIVLIHPSLTQWDYFEYVIPYLEKENQKYMIKRPSQIACGGRL